MADSQHMEELQMAAEKKRAEKTSFILGYIGEDGQPITDRKNMAKRRFAATSFSHDEDSEKQQSESLRGSDADVFGEDGFLWGSGGFEMEIPLLGALDILRTLLRDANPVSTKIPEKTLVAGGTNLSDIVAADYFTDTADVTIDAVDDQELKDTSVDVVKGQNLSGAGDKTIAKDLSEHADALTLTVTPSGSATLTSTGTPGTVVITYTTAAGQTRTFTLSFANAVKTDAQTRELPAGATITRVQATGWSAGTFDITTAVSDKDIANNLSGYADALTLTVTPTSAATLTNTGTPGTVDITYRGADGATKTITLSFADSAKTNAQMTDLPVGATILRVQATGWSAGKFDITTAIAGNIARNPEANRPGQIRVKYTGALTGHKMLIRGVRRVGLASDDTLPLREEIELGADILSGKYFHRINKVELKDASGAIVDAASISGSVEIQAEPGGYETVLKMSNDLIQLMMEAEVGGIPRKITRGEFISGQLNISDTVRLVIDMLSKRVDKRSTIEGGDDEKFVGTAAEHPTEFPFVSEKFFPDWGGYLELDDEAFVFDSATVDINRNEDFSSGKRASRFRAELESSDRRNVTAQIQGSYISGTDSEDKFIRWDEKFRNNEAVKARIANYHWPTSGRQYSMEWILNYCEITSPVRVEASSPGTIPITIDLKAVPDPTVAGSSELTVRIVSDDRWM